MSTTVGVTNMDMFLPKEVASIRETERLFHSSIKSNSDNFGNMIKLCKSEITDSNDSKTSIISEIPTISNQFESKLIIKAEIKDLLLVDKHFNYILFNILKIVNDTFDEYGTSGHVEVALKSDEDNPKWKHADIKINLDDELLVSEIWRKISRLTKEFFKTTDARKLMPGEILNRIHKFIYVIID